VVEGRLNARAARMRLLRVGEGVAVSVGGGALLVLGASWVERGEVLEALVVLLRLMGALLVLGGALGAARARTRGEVGALAAMGGRPLGWSVSGALLGALLGALTAALLVALAKALPGWRWDEAGTWWLDGRPLDGSQVPTPLSEVALRATPSGACRGAIAAVLGVQVGLARIPAGATLLLALLCAMGVVFAG
jgi:hypothetical protein